jgi:hypothetical protein
MEGDAVGTRTVEDLVPVECERCDAEEFLGFHTCRACARLLDPRRTHVTDAAEPPRNED